jgi:hypothetical protein
MLKQEELAFVKALSTMELFPALLRQLRKAMATRKRSRAGAPSKAKPPSVVTSKRHSTVSCAAIVVQPSGKPLQNPAAKTKAEELSSSGGSSGPASRRPTSNPLDGPSAPGTSGEAAASCKSLPGKDGPAYAAVVFGHAKPQQAGGPPKPSAKGSDTSEPAASSGAASRLMSTDMSGPPTDASSNKESCQASAGERHP